MANQPSMTEIEFRSIKSGSCSVEHGTSQGFLGVQSRLVLRVAWNWSPIFLLGYEVLITMVKSIHLVHWNFQVIKLGSVNLEILSGNSSVGCTKRTREGPGKLGGCMSFHCWERPSPILAGFWFPHISIHCSRCCQLTFRFGISWSNQTVGFIG